MTEDKQGGSIKYIDKNGKIKDLMEDVWVMGRGFSPSQEQWDCINAWEEEHIRKYHRKTPMGECKYNPYAESFEYRFQITNLGKVGDVVCTKCRRKIRNRIKWMLYTDAITAKRPRSAEETYSFFIGEV